MTFSEALKHFCVEETIPYRNAHGKLTNRGSFVIRKLAEDEMLIEIPNQNTRRLHRSDWDEVVQNLVDIQKERKVCQSMKTQNATYILSLWWSINDAKGPAQ